MTHTGLRQAVVTGLQDQDINRDVRYQHEGKIDTVVRPIRVDGRELFVTFEGALGLSDGLTMAVYADGEVPDGPSAIWVAYMTEERPNRQRSWTAAPLVLDVPCHPRSYQHPYLRLAQACQLVAGVAALNRDEEAELADKHPGGNNAHDVLVDLLRSPGPASQKPPTPAEWEAYVAGIAERARAEMDAEARTERFTVALAHMHDDPAEATRIDAIIAAAEGEGTTDLPGYP